MRAVGAGTVCSACGYGLFPGAGDGRFAGMRFDLSLRGDDIYYAHLERIAAVPGEQVARGEVVGLSGEANGVEHLHIACRVCNPFTLAP